MMIKTLILSLTLTTTIFAECDYTTLEEATVTASKDNGNSLGPTRDQDGIGWCYAYTGADIMEQWLKEKNVIPPDENVSAVSMAINSQELGFTLYNQQFQISAMHDSGIEDPSAWASERYLEITEKLDKINAPLETSMAAAMDAIYEMRKNEIGPLREEISDLKTKIAEAPANLINLTAQHDQLKETLSVKISEMRRKSKEAWDTHNAETFFRDRPQILTRIELLKQQETYYRYLSTPSLSDSVPFPEGGNMLEAVYSSWPNICFESEVSSRDQDLIDELGKHATLREAFEEMITARFDTAGCIECVALQYADTVFQGIGNLEDLVKIVSQLAPHENGFSQLMNQACANKNLSTLEKPQFSKEKVSRTVPIDQTINQAIFSKIDEAINSGKIASISYHASLLYQEGFPLDGKSYDHDAHASVITGSMSICGEKYYKLRNSWGNDSCSYIQKRMIEVRGNTDNLPYLCDGEGNYIIKQSHLQKGTYGTSHIQN